MKKQLLNSPVRLLLLLFAVICMYASDIKAQCFATAQLPLESIAICNDFEDVVIPITLGGTAPFTFTYQVNGVPTQPVTTSTSNYLLFLPNPSSGSVLQLTSVTDATACQGAILGTGSVVISVTTLEIDIISTPVSCNGGNNGTANVTITGGSPPYTYLWSNGSTAPLGNVPAGLYSLTITDANGCTASANAEITEAPPIVISTLVTSPTCNNQDGVIDATITGGTGPYQILWSTGSNTEDLTNLGSGNYTVTVTDPNGCTGTHTVSIGPFDLDIQSGVNDCLTDFDLSVSGGVGPYTFLWSTNAVTEDVTGLGGGIYTVTVTDASGCTAVTSATSHAFPLLTANIVINSSQCNGGLTAQITGWPSFNTTFLWSTGGTGQLLTNIPVGTYTVTATASNSCTATATVTTASPLSNANINISATVINASCFGGANGAINLTVSGGTPPFTYLWSIAAINTHTINNLVAGAYTVTITDANGCTATISRNVTQPLAISASWQVTNAICNAATGSIGVSVSGGALPYTFAWRRASDNSLISTTQNLTNVLGGTYYLNIVDITGCTYTSPNIVVQPLPFSVNVELLSTQCTSATLVSVISGNSAPYQFAWTGPNGYTSNTQNITVSLSGLYTVIVIDANGCLRQSSFQVNVLGIGPCGYISGRLLRDDVDNCLTDTGEPGLTDWLVRAESPADTFYGISGIDGYYWVNVPPGTYTMATVAPNGLWSLCPAGPAVTLDMTDDTIPAGDLLVKPVFHCPSLTVVIGTSLLRRCFNNNYYHITYCNQGTAPAVDAYVLVTLDPFLTPVSSTIPYTDLGGGVLRFNVGDLATGECHTLQLRVAVSCGAALGQTHCTEAHIYPDGNCIPANSSWSGASLRVTSQCNADSVRFTIKNIGIFDMETTSDYIVVEDAVMLMTAPFLLDAGDSTIVAVPTNGSTWRVEVDQVAFHPGLSAPALSVEGCTNNSAFSTGFVNQFPNNDADAWIDIDCTPNIGSYDPNDKQGFPIGYGTEHYIRPGTELEYLIRFQNTGTDTAFTVRIADTLSAWLDPATIRPGVSSHAYQLNLTGPGIAEFLFENILLPDSNVNQAASNGFVKFSIYPKADAPLETLIENSAAIYFDFNEAVITNTTRHRLGENFLLVGAWQPHRPEYQVLVSPNPFHETALLEVKGLTSSLPIRLQIIDLQGNVVHDEMSAGPVLTLRKAGLPTGMYLFKLDQKGAPVGSGKLIIRD